jgi:hypothetical protein
LNSCGIMPFFFGQKRVSSRCLKNGQHELYK